MISRILIHKFLSISNTEIKNLSDQLNCITGESGAGKTVFLKSILYALCKNDYVNELKNEDVFVELDFNGKTISRLREKSKNFYKLNGVDVKKDIIQSFVNEQIQVISQNGSHLLKNEAYAISYVDKFLNKEDLINYKKKFEEFCNKKNTIKKLDYLMVGREERIENLRMKIDKIEELGLEPADENLQEKYENIIKNKKNEENFEKAMFLIENDDYDLVSVLKDISNLLRNDQKVSNHIRNAITEILNVKSYVIKSNNKSNENDEEEILNRINNIQKVKQLFKVKNIQELIDLHQKLQGELNELENIEKEYDNVCREVESLERLITVLAQDLHNKREIISSEVSKKMNVHLSDLMMTNTKFKAESKISKEVNENGKTNVSFEISADNGKTYKPISMVASGGEMSRILLSLAEIDSLGKVLIFDEIDNGIGGATGIVLSEKIRRMSNQNQVILITHLSHLAHKSDSHFIVEKNGENRSLIRCLYDDERFEEVGRMISGKKGDIAINIAKEIMK